MKILTAALHKVIEIARILGSDERDLQHAESYLPYNEHEFCFDIIITQMYEYDIEIDADFYESISRIGEKINLEPSTYSMMKELIRQESRVPQSLRDELKKVIGKL